MTLLNEMKEQVKQAITPMPSQEQDSGGQVLEFTGLDLREKAGSGAYLECSNVSTRNYPCLSPRIGRSYADESVFQGVDDIYRYDGKTLYRIGTELFFHDGTTSTKVATVDDSRKSFAVVNNRLTIWPDGTYIHLGTGEYKLLGARMSVTDGEIADNRTISGTFHDRTGAVSGTDVSDILTESFGELQVAYLDGDDEVWKRVKWNDYTWLIGKTCIPAYTGSGYCIRYANYANGKRYSVKEANGLGVRVNITGVTLRWDKQHEYSYYITGTATIPTGKVSAQDDILREGDVVFVSGLKKDSGEKDDDGEIIYEDVPEMAMRIWGVTASSVTFPLNSLYGYAIPDDTEICIERRVPNMDYICANDNRLWGVSNAVDNTVKDDDGNTKEFKGRAIYASKLGDPGNWFYYQSVSMDSWAAAVASEGDFTGICSWSGDVLCFKEREVFRVTGSVPSAYTLYSFSMPGVEQGSGGSIAVIDEVVYYKSEHGVYRYSGGTPTRVSENVAAALTGAGNAGTDGRNYFLSVPGGIYVYDTWHNAWAKHDTAVGRFAWDGSVALFLRDSDRSVSHVDAGNADGMAWGATLHPDYCTTQSGYYSVTLNISYKYFRYVFLRGEIFNKSGRTTITKKNAQGETVTVPYVPYVRVHAKLGDKEEEMIGEQSGVGKFLLRMPVTKYREDCIRIRLEGLGDCLLRDIRYVYSTGSEWVQSDKGVM